MKNNTMSLGLGALVAAVLALIGNLILLYGVTPYVGLTGPFAPLSLMPVAMWSILGVVGAAIVFAIVRKFSKNPNTVFLWVAVIVLVLSFIPDVLVKGMTTGPFAGASWGAVLLLMLMHIVAASVVLYVFLNKVRTAAPVATVPPAPAAAMPPTV